MKPFFTAAELAEMAAADAEIEQDPRTQNSVRITLKTEKNARRKKSVSP